MTPVEKALRQFITLDGPQTLERVMGLANGYYYASRDPLGKDGDFTTAPEISQMFGEMIGLWLCAAWESAAKPAAVNLVELGPGRGSLMDDALRIIARVAPAFFAGLSVHLVESSPVLQALQKERLAKHARPAFWHSYIEEIPTGFSFIIGNEFLDALAVRHFIRKHDGWHEKCVTLQDDVFVFALSPEVSPESIIPVSFQNTPLEACAEFSPATHSTVTLLSRHLAMHGGAALLIDYGHTQSQCGDTVQALRQHKKVPVLDNLGDADLTAHVDFEAASRTALAEGCAVQGAFTQAAFLHQMGLGARAAQLAANASLEQQQSIHSAFNRLTSTSTPTDMGTLFKVLCIHHPSLPPLAGFLQHETEM